MKEIQVVTNVLKENDLIANRNQQLIQEHRILAINILSAPGSGKTSLLEKTITEFSKFRYAVLVGDLQTNRDAARLTFPHVQTLQINTGRGCHLTADQINEGLRQLNLNAIDILFIENVGNMVCPSNFFLGEHVRVVMLSIPEGDDKIAKYPVMFQHAQLIILNKIDLLHVLDYNMDQILTDLSSINTQAPLIKVSCRTKEGLQAWFDWLTETYYTFYSQ